MKKLFSLKDCAEDEPTSPDAGTSNEGGDNLPGGSDAEQWLDYANDCAAWLTSCIAAAQPGGDPPQDPPIINVYPTKFQDNKGYIWIRTVSSEGIDFKLDFFDIPIDLKSYSFSNSDTHLIIGIRISLNDYSILTLSQDGIKMQKLKRNKVRFVNLLSIISNHAKIPNVDMNKISKDFWNSHR